MPDLRAFRIPVRFHRRRSPWTVVLLVAAALACGTPPPVPTTPSPSANPPTAQPPSVGPMWVGVEYAYAQAAEAFRDSGATSAKPYPEVGAWNAVQPEQGGSYIWGPVDKFVAAFQQAGFRHLTLMLRGESSWASVDPPRPPVHRGDTTAKREYEGDFAAYVQAYVERYDGDGVDDMPGLLYPVFLYGFEPEFSTYVPGSAASYIHMLELAYPAVKRANAEAQLMNAGMLLTTVFDGYPSQDEIARRLASPDSRIFDKSPSDIALLLDHPELFDVLDVHSLTDYSELVPMVGWLRQEMSRRGYSKPIWIGDTFGGATLNSYGPAMCPGGPWTSILGYPATEEDRCQVAAALDALRSPSDQGHEEALAWIRAESAAGIVRKIVIAGGEGLAGINMGNVEDWEPLMLALGGAGTSPWQGMLDRNLLTKQPLGRRPSFFALQQIATLIQSTESVQRLPSYDERTYVYQFRLSDGGVVDVVWTDTGLWLPGMPMPTRPVRIPVSSETVEVEWTVTAGETPIRETRSGNGGFVEVEIGSIPAFLIEAAGS